MTPTDGGAHVHDGGLRYQAQDYLFWQISYSRDRAQGAGVVWRTCTPGPKVVLGYQRRNGQ